MAHSPELSDKARKIYELLLVTPDMTKEELIRDAKIKEEDYGVAKKELIDKRLAKARKGRSGGLSLLESDQVIKRKDSNTVAVAEKLKSITEKERELLDALPKDGSYVTNLSLRLKLRRKGFTTKDFWDYRKKLLDKHVILVGMGQGGRTARAEDYVKPSEEESKFVDDESELWPLLEKWLRNNQKPAIEQDAFSQNAYAKVFVANTANSKSEGQWTNPDVMLISVFNFKYLPQKKDLAIYTYEVKKFSAGNLRDAKSVFEAASHQRGAHYSYLVIENSQQNSKDPVPEKLADMVERFGIGFAWFFRLPSGEYDMLVVLEPKLQTPSPVDINNYMQHFIDALGEKERGEFETSI